MNSIMIRAFVDEVTKIKKASMFKNIGDGALGLGKAMISNARNTLLAFKTPVTSIKTGIGASGGIMGKTLTGAGAVLGAPEAFSRVDPTGQERSRVERAATWAGDQAGGLIGAPHGLFTGSLVGGIVGKNIGKLTGKAVDKVIHPQPNLPHTESY